MAIPTAEQKLDMIRLAEPTDAEPTGGRPPTGGAGAGGGDSGRPDDSSAPAPARRSIGERILRPGLHGAAWLPLLVLGVIVVALAIKAWPAIRVNGFGFLTKSEWYAGDDYGNPVTTNGVSHLPHAAFGVWPLIVGTLASSAIR